MTAHASPAPSAVRTSTSAFSRIYGLGTVYAKTLRDSRLAVMIVGGLMAAFLLSGAAAFGQAYSTIQSRVDLANLVKSLPPALSGVYGNPFPANIETLGGSIGWKTGASLGLMAALWSVLALSGTLAAEARRGSLEFVATTRLGMRRIAVEKVAAHLTGMAIVVVVVAVSTWVGGSVFATLPGDEISAASAIGFALWVGGVALASGAVAFALAPILGRGAAAAIAGAILLVGYFVNGYQAAVPAFAGPANLTWFGWTARHQPLAGQFDWPSLIPVAVVSLILFIVGVEAFARRDIGATSPIPTPSLPRALVGLQGPTGRGIGQNLPSSLAWGLGIGLFGLAIAGSGKSFIDELGKATDFVKLLNQVFPGFDIRSVGGFLQLLYVEFGLILAGLAAATLVAVWGSDETSGRLEFLLASPLSRVRWVASGGVAILVGVVVVTVVAALGIALGAVIAGGDIVQPVVGSLVLPLYAAALGGIGVAVGGLFRTSWAGPAVALVTIVTWLINLLAPAFKLPDFVHQLALTSHYGFTMLGHWDPVGIVLSLVLAVGGVLLGAWGFNRRDVRA